MEGMEEGGRMMAKKGSLVEWDGVIDMQRELARLGVTHTDVADKFQDPACVAQ
jgi:hypothetical protein